MFISYEKDLFLQAAGGRRVPFAGLNEVHSYLKENSPITGRLANIGRLAPPPHFLFMSAIVPAATAGDSRKHMKSL